MKLAQVYRTIKEYNTSGDWTTLAAPGGDKATGKVYDNIITGEAQPYKTKEYETKYARQYPALAAIVKRIKNDSFKGDVIVTGKALVELGQLLQQYKPKTQENGEVSLPFGDNVRVKPRGQQLFIGLSDAAKQGIDQIPTDMV